MKPLIALCLILLPSLAFTSVSASLSTVPAAQSSNDEPINKLCPIGVEPNDGETFATYNGHRLGFCCSGCDTKFLAWSKEKKDAFVAAALAGQEGQEKEGSDPKAKERTAEPYTLSTCPVSGEKLGAMGDPVVITAEGRDVKLCCKGCVGKIEKEPAKYLAVVDAGFVAQQKPYYPLTTCVVGGEPLVEDGKDIALDVVIKNRLFRLCCKGCVKKLKANAETHFTALDAAVKRAQVEEYPLDTCIVREKSKLGSMGDPTELVVGNRLVRFCCSGCQTKFADKPAKYLVRLDAAWAPIQAKRAEAEPGESNTHGDKDGHAHDKDGHR